MSLNELDPGMDNIICRTDSRFRPDIRKLEQGDIDGAAIEKTRLEEKQRDASKQRKSKKSLEWSPRYIIIGRQKIINFSFFILNFFFLDGLSRQ